MTTNNFSLLETARVTVNNKSDTDCTDVCREFESTTSTVGMGCSTSSQTSAVDSTKPGVKTDESNGTSSPANGNVAEDRGTIPDRTSLPPPPSAESCDRNDEMAEATAQEPQLQLMEGDADAAPARPRAEAAASPQNAPSQNASTQAEAADSTEPKQETEEAPASID